ncbi:MAG: 4-carboxymuconolactone decarboxylase [Rhizobiales bacterium NRL2]|jgi:4-carboxymuconolactone decarboxylase|nr:MAG: 4-carboxymuconolactone decarboxylase [Rhizobiales bacterium NRL2]
MSDELFEKGLKIRKEVLGEAYVDKTMGAADAFNRDFQHWVTASAWGAAWGQETLSRRDRSLLNLVMLAALGRGTEFKLHVKGAVNNGVTLAEMKDALLHMTVYCGAPAGVEAFRLARQALEEIGVDPAEADQAPT